MTREEWKDFVKNYQKQNVFDPDRMSIKECDEQELPYINEEGKLINTHRFLEAGQFYQKHRVYTKEPQGSKAEVDFWKEERKRKREGLWLGQIRITGYHYFFLNYHRMKVVNEGEEIDGFGSFWNIHFWVFHLIDFADHIKQNIALIKLRGCGLSELAASFGEADFLIPNFDSRGNPLHWNNAYFASDDRYITGDDGIFTKATRAIEWVNKNCNEVIFNRPGALMDNTSYHWVAGYRDKENVPHQTGGEIKASVVKKADQTRGGRKRRIFHEECQIVGSQVLMYDGQYRKIEDIKVGDKLMGVDSKPREVLKITRNKGKLLSCYTNTKKKKQSKPFMYVTPNHRLWVRKYKKNTNHNYDIAISAEDYMSLSKSELESLYGVKTKLIKFPYKETLLDPYYLGVWLGDGSSSDQVIVVNEKDKEISDFLEKYQRSIKDTELHVYTPATKKYSKGNQCRYYRIKQTSDLSGKGSSPVLAGLQEYNLIDNKHIPKDFKINSEEIRLQVLAGLIDTDGSLVKNKPTNKHATEHYTIQQLREVIIDDAKFIADSLGFFTYKYEYKPNKDGNTYYTLVIKGDLSRIPTKVERKQAQKAEEKTLFKFSVIDEGIEDDYVGLTLDGDQLYITDDFIVTHNSGANPVLGKSLSVAEGTTRRGTVKTGIQIIWGTSNEDSRGIDAFRKVLQSPSAYDVLSFENVWEAVRRGEEFLDLVPWNPFDYVLPPGSDGVGFFIPAYEIKFMDKFGNPDRHKGYNLIMEEREKKLRNVANDDEDVLQFFADYPLYMEEALMTTKGKRFSSDSLSRHRINIETGIVKPEIHRGSLEYIKEGAAVVGVRWYDDPVGKLRILEHPEWVIEEGTSRYTLINDPKRKWRLYIGGIDSIDQGTGDSAGEGSSLAYLIKKRMDKDTFMSDSFSNAYVSLYKERPDKVRDAYDNVLKLMIYFNALSLLEYTKMNIVTHIVDIMKFPQFLATEPSAPGVVIKSWRKNMRRKGIRVTKDVLGFYLGLIDSYIEDYADHIMFKELLDEILDYELEKKTKFDLVASMGMCEILTTELIDSIPIQLHSDQKDITLGTARWYTDHNGYKKWGTPPNPMGFARPELRNVAYIDKHGNPVYDE